MTELNFSLSEIAQERSILLLSKASDVPVEAIERLQIPLQVEEITEEDLQQIDAIATALEVEIINLIPPGAPFVERVKPTARDVFIDRVVRMVQQKGVEIEATEVFFPVSRGEEMMHERIDGSADSIILLEVKPQCFPYTVCVAAGRTDCIKPSGC